MKRSIELEPVTNGAADRPVLITGGAGFVGTNVADRLLRSGRRVIVYDNLSRPGVEANLRWLRATHGSSVQVETADVRDERRLERVVRRAGAVYHFAAQVAVTTSLVDPAHDFEVNARGTLNLLHAIRSQPEPPPLLFTSTNKVYGALEDVALERTATRYAPVDPGVADHGIGESRPLDFHSPYGCSKGAADQYVIDHARTYGLPAVVFRMSCIYGPHQFGTEDQGWVAHFLLRALRGESITLYGDGLQVRDVLYIDDLVDAMLLAQQNITRVAGRAFNIGGGPSNTTSLREVVELIGRVAGAAPAVTFDEWRPGDQRYYVSDTRSFQRATGWRPRTGVEQGVQQLYAWLQSDERADAEVLRLRPRRAASTEKRSAPPAITVAGGER